MREVVEEVVIDGQRWTVIHTWPDRDEALPVEQATAAPGERRSARRRRRPWFSRWTVR